MTADTIDRVCERMRTLTQPARCLYVEDSDSDFELLTRKLRSYRVVVERASNADSAVNALKANRFDIVILDLTLKCPGNGIGVLRHIRSLPEHPPVIVLTGAEVDGSVYQQAMELGVGAIMQKPLTAQQAGLLFGTL